MPGKLDRDLSATMQHCSEIIQLNCATADRAPDLGPSGRRARGALFAPKSVALIGATETVGSVGRAVLENLRAFSGPVYPVNPKHGRVLGVKAYPSIAAVPERVDLAVIVTPVATVPGIISECAEAGARAAVIISAGFKECGADGAALEGAILAGRGGMRIVGPNCLGLMIPALGFNATFATTLARPGAPC